MMRAPFGLSANRSSSVSRSEPAGNGATGASSSSRRMGTTVSGTSLTLNGAPIALGDGIPQVLAVGNGKIFVGARTCTTGCLSIVDQNSKAVVIDAQKGVVTGATAIPRHNTFYVTEGGELRIYDTTTSAESTSALIDIVGNAQDVIVIDK